MKKLFIIILFAVIIQWTGLFAADNGHVRSIKWEGVKTEQLTETQSISYLFFSGAIYNMDKSHFPVYREQIAMGNNVTKFSAEIINPVFEQIDDKEVLKVNGWKKIGKDIVVDASIGYEMKKPLAFVSFIPIRKNQQTGKYEKLISFEIKTSPLLYKQGQPKSTIHFMQNSVLNHGTWYKIKVNHDGIYKLDY